MNNQSDKNLIRLLTLALIIGYASILFLSSRYLDLVDQQTKILIKTEPQNIRQVKISEPTIIEPATSQPIVTQPEVSDLLDSLKYSSEKMGFELQFPKTWQGYIVSAPNINNPVSVGFSFKAPHQPFTIFNINQYTKSQWNTLKKNSMIKLIDQVDGSVLACDGCCSITADTTGGGQFDQFQIARCKEVPVILKSLKLIK